MDEDIRATAAPPVGATAQDPRGHERPEVFRWRFAGRRPTDLHDPVDFSSVLGMPLGSVPEPVQRAVAALIDEVERLRAELDHAHGHETWLEDRSDHHPMLQVLHRRAFLRELDHLVVQSERVGLPGSLIYLHVGGIGPLRAIHGLAAGDGALAHVVAGLRAELRQTDLLGYLDGGDFVVALALAEDEGAQDKARTMADRVSQAVFSWNGKSFLFTAASGIARFRPGADAARLLAIADADRRGAREETLSDDVWNQGVLK